MREPPGQDSGGPVIGAVVLAAGEGRRFGGAKLAADLGGCAMLDYVLNAVLAVPAIERIVVVLGSHADEVAARSDLTGVETVVCQRWHEGISASLRAGVEALGDCEAVVVLLGDQPFITPQVIAAIIDQIDTPEPAARATYSGSPGHPVLIKRALFDRVRRLPGQGGARAMLAEAGAREVELGGLFDAEDVNTRADLEAARAKLTEGATR